jgi:hypothetical protein
MPIMKTKDQNFMTFHREACEALNEATRNVRAKGACLPQADQITALTMAHLRVAAMLLAEMPEIDPAIFDGEMTKHVANTIKQVAEHNEWKRKQAMT